MRELKTLGFLCLFLCSTIAYADGPVRQKLAKAVAVVAAHEGALKNLKDVDLVWQTVQFNGDTDEERLRWLRNHSGRSLGLKPCTENNCTWSTSLGKKTLPASVASLGTVDPAYWKKVTAPRFERVYKRAQELVNGATYERPCAIDPHTWGGVGKDPLGADDREHAARDGLYPIGCTGVLNDGFAPKKAFALAGIEPK